MLYLEDIQLNEVHRSRDYTVSPEEIIEFAKMWDPQPFHIDETAAKQHPFGGLTGSSAHSYSLMTKLLEEMKMEAAVVAALGVDEMRLPNPLRANDVVHVESYIESKRKSSSKPDMGIMVSVNKLINQNSDVILSLKNAGLIMRQP